jgi:hypothetical protein
VVSLRGPGFAPLNPTSTAGLFGETQQMCFLTCGPHEM